MKQNWFKEWGWIYRPVSWQGWLTTVIILLFCSNVFLVVDGRSHSASDTFYGIFPYVVPALLFWGWVASRTSSRR